MKKKRILYVTGIIIGLALIGGCLYLNSLLPIITGYAAKNLCSDVFISGRQPTDVESLDLNFSLIKFTRNKVNLDDKSVSSRFLWGRSKAIYREGFGVTLVKDVSEEVLRKSVYPVDTKPGYRQDTTAWPLGDVVSDTISTGINKAALDEITRKVINDNAYNGNAFAFLVIHKGMPVAEAYKPRFSRNTRFISWSVAKSFVNGLIGVLSKEGKMDIYQKTGIKEWENDERKNITINDLMQMQSGLKWNEGYGNRSDVTVMLHCTGDMSGYAIKRPPEYPAGTNFYYSSGSANILSYLIRKEFDSDTSCYAFIQDKFFERIGITEAIFETDPAGDFVGSSYLYATARDYARFALLYLNDGMFDHERILPEGWVAYTTTPASGSKGEYGSLFHLNRGGKYPSAPENMFMCEGHDGQEIFMLPSEQMAVVILGYSPTPDHVMDFDRLLKDILSTLMRQK